MKDQLAEVLVNARQRIADPARWAQGALAREHHGWQTGASDYDAVCWCALGAVAREADNRKVGDEATRALNRTAVELGFPSVVTINDAYKHRGDRMKAKAHAATLMVFDLAIAKALS